MSTHAPWEYTPPASEDYAVPYQTPKPHNHQKTQGANAAEYSALASEYPNHGYPNSEYPDATNTDAAYPNAGYPDTGYTQATTAAPAYGAGTGAMPGMPTASYVPFEGSANTIGIGAFGLVGGAILGLAAFL